MPAKSLELKHTIKLIRELDAEIEEIETEIKTIMDEINSPILTIPGISYRMGAMILAVISAALIRRTGYLLMLECRRPPTSQGSLITVMPTWKNVVQDTCAMPFTMQRNMSATGINLLPPTLPKNGQRVSIITSPCHMPQRSLCG